MISVHHYDVSSVSFYLQKKKKKIVSISISDTYLQLNSFYLLSNLKPRVEIIKCNIRNLNSFSYETKVNVVYNDSYNKVIIAIFFEWGVRGNLYTILAISIVPKA